MRGTIRDVNELAVLDEINRLLDVTDDAAAGALRQVLETLVMESALRLHYSQHPEAKPTLAEVALALAAQDGSPLADLPEVVAAAANAVTARHPDADADDVLLWAEAQLAMSA